MLGPDLPLRVILLISEKSRQRVGGVCQNHSINNIITIKLMSLEDADILHMRVAGLGVTGKADAFISDGGKNLTINSMILTSKGCATFRKHRHQDRATVFLVTSSVTPGYLLSKTQTGDRTPHFHSTSSVALAVLQAPDSWYLCDRPLETLGNPMLRRDSHRSHS